MSFAIHEEGWCKGSNHDDIGFVGVVHFPLYLGFLHLVIETNLVNALSVYRKRSKASVKIQDYWEIQCLKNEWKPL